MKRKIAIYPYKKGSRSATALAKAVDATVIKREGSAFKPKGKVIVNWGSSELPVFIVEGNCYIYNHHHHVVLMGNKLQAFQRWSGQRNPPRIPWYEQEFLTAREHMIKTNHSMMARTVLTGHSGRGIIYVDDPANLPVAPLYVEYIKKAAEYRLHYFFHNKARPFIQRKMKRREVAKEEINWKVRNREGGFIYANDPVNIGEVPVDVKKQARRAFEYSGLEFGAVDVIYNKKQGKAYVLEINTAPGLEGATLDYYATNLISLASNS